MVLAHMHKFSSGEFIAQFAENVRDDQCEFGEIRFAWG